jgi:competence protein ComEC
MIFSFRKILVFIIIFLALILFSQFAFSYNSPVREDFLVVNFLDVGQGDSILINYQNKYQILVDSGISNKNILTELKKVMPAQDRSLEIVIATHYDKDHVGGMRSVFENYKVKLFLDNGQFKDTQATTVVSDLLEKQKIENYAIQENSKIKIDEDLLLDFFNPDGEDWETNDNSIVFRMDFGENSFLFTGDAGFKTEKDMMEDGHNLDVDYLKVAHHGSKNSSDKDFLEKVSPEKAIISVGKNSYGHPTEETMERIKKVDSEIFTTLDQGLIQLICEKNQACLINFFDKK